MAIYSHSKLGTFEQCRYKYKLQYIDRVKVDIPNTVEAFLGDQAHRTLEKLYSDLNYQKLDSLEGLLDFYRRTWDREWTDDILIVKQEYTADNYRKMGEKYITDYYERYRPFDQMQILGLETQDKIRLPDGSLYHVRIDKLGCRDNAYYVCDYKTNKKLMTQEEADADRQLALYSAWVRERFPDAEKVVLLWHMLAFNREVFSERTDAEIDRLKEETVELIQRIESCSEFPTTVTPLCNYCVYREICPSFKHDAELEEKTVQAFKDDEGVKLVDEYAELNAQKKEIEKRLDALKEKLVAFSRQMGLDVVYGSDIKASIKEYPKVVFPEDKTALIDLIKARGLYEELTMLNYPGLRSRIVKGEIHEDIAGLARIEKEYRVGMKKKKKSEA